MDIIKSYDINLRLVLRNRHQKNILEPRHSTVRSIFLRARHTERNISDPVHDLSAVRISNDLYGTDVISAFEAEKGYRRPVQPDMPPVTVDSELLQAHGNLIARRKLKRILRSNSLSSNDFRVDDLVQIYVKHGKQKRGTWLSPRQVNKIDTDAGMLTVPSAAGHSISVPFKDQ